ncbi:MAG: hypothetical protein ABEJ23_06565 [Haloarculaceae archaeon]
MDAGIAGAVEDWEQRPFSGGYRGLQDLVDREFSGAVQAAGCWLLLINGRVVGVYEERDGRDGPEQEPADVERIEGASGTVYEAPHVALPLLFTMQVDGGEVVERGSTTDRSLEAVHDELEAEGFTGYLVLSEHVLSGEYYVVYQGGRSMSVAFIGGARRLKTGDEAFDRAKKEVGVYEVHSVQLHVTDVPEPTEDEAAVGAAAAGTDRDGDADDEADPASIASATGETATDEPAASDEPGEATEAVDDADGPVADDAGEPVAEESDDDEATAATDEDATDDADEPVAEKSAGDDLAAVGTEPPPEPSAEPDADAFAPGDGAEESDDGAAAATDDDATDDGTGSETTDDGAGDETTATPAVTELDAEAWPPGRESAESADDAAVEDDERDAAAVENGEREPVAASGDRSVDRLAARVDRLAEQQDDLAATVDRLAARLDRLVGGDGTAVEASEQRTPAAALSETTLLVRYQSEGGPTLESVYEGGSDREALAQNLRLEPRTPFDPSETAVDGEAYGEFLQSAIEYRFVAWLVGTLPFEVQAAEATGELRDLYDALPSIDRATLAQAATDDGPQFDVVLQNREGAPLAVVRIDERDEPPSRATAEELIRDARDVERASSTLAAAFLVTTSFVDGAALDPVRDATRSRLLSRERRESYVNLSSGGYHLCLVEAGRESFHLAVPDL